MPLVAADKLDTLCLMPTRWDGHYQSRYPYLNTPASWKISLWNLILDTVITLEVDFLLFETQYPSVTRRYLGLVMRYGASCYYKRTSHWLTSLLSAPWSNPWTRIWLKLAIRIESLCPLGSTNQHRLRVPSLDEQKMRVDGKKGIH